MRSSLLSATSLMIGLGLAGVAAADPAPIVYAGQGGASRSVQTAALEDNRLAGGADNSYGYGNTRTTRSAPIDIRRAGQGAAPAQSAAPAAGQGAPAWLERERVGPPYEANGRWYVPTAEPGYEQIGQASWYGPTFHGQAGANGATYDQEAMTAAHPTLPLNSLVQVTNLRNGREVMVRITDRGPFVGERLIDLSRAAADVLGFEQSGTTRVHVRYLGPAPRRVNADGSSAPAPALAPSPLGEPQREPPAAPELAQAGPISLLPEAASADPEPAYAAPSLQQTSYTPTPAPVGAGGFVVQVGAYGDLSNAHRVRALVESAGPVNVDARQTARGELFRVRLGPWRTREEAEAARRTLAGLGYPEAVIAQP